MYFTENIFGKINGFKIIIKYYTEMVTLISRKFY